MNEVLGTDMLGTETELRKVMDANKFEYECGHFKVNKHCKDRTVYFVRIKNFREVLEQHRKNLIESSGLTIVSVIPINKLIVLLCGDKGGGQTKLLFQLLDCRDIHSIWKVKPLAIFEEASDSREHIEKVCIENSYSGHQFTLLKCLLNLRQCPSYRRRRHFRRRASCMRHYIHYRRRVSCMRQIMLILSGAPGDCID